MSIFKRHDQGNEQTVATPYADAAAPAGLPEQPANLATQFAPPGVVPPPAAPIYSMRPPEPAPAYESNADSSMAESIRRAATETQQWAQDLADEVAPAAAPRARAMASPARSVATYRTPRAASPRLRSHHHEFDPRSAAQTGLLNLAWHWQQAGAPIRAIHTYLELITRHPHSAAAGAAVADLVELSEKLAHHGYFHIALGIYEELEEVYG